MIASASLVRVHQPSQFSSSRYHLVTKEDNQQVSREAIVDCNESFVLKSRSMLRKKNVGKDSLPTNNDCGVKKKRRRVFGEIRR